MDVIISCPVIGRPVGLQVKEPFGGTVSPQTASEGQQSGSESVSGYLDACLCHCCNNVSVLRLEKKTLHFPICKCTVPLVVEFMGIS